MLPRIRITVWCFGSDQKETWVLVWSWRFSFRSFLYCFYQLLYFNRQLYGDVRLSGCVLDSHWPHCCYTLIVNLYIVQCVVKVSEK